MNHHSVYVVLLRNDVIRIPKVINANPKRDPRKPCVYVGMTGLTPEERFENHKKGYKAGKGYVRDYGIKLLTELYKDFNPMSYEDAVTMEKKLALVLKEHGYTVCGG